MIPTFTLSVISHGHGSLLHALLDDIAAFENANAYRLIVTLNLAQESFTPSDWPGLDIRVLRNSQPKGFGANHNQAFHHCDTPWFAVLNPDLRMAYDPFPKLLEQAANVERLGAMTPAVLAPDGREEDHIRHNLSPLALWRRSRGSKMEAIDISRPAGLDHCFYWLAGMFLAFPREAYAEVGGFDERFFLYCEDYDICARLVLKRYRLLSVPTICVTHAAQRDSHRSSRHLRWHLISLLKVWTSVAYWRLVFSNST